MNWKDTLHKGDLSFLSHNTISNKKFNHEKFSTVVEKFIEKDVIEKLFADFEQIIPAIPPYQEPLKELKKKWL